MEAGTVSSGPCSETSSHRTLKVYLTLPEVVSYSSHETPKLVAMLEHNMEEAITIRTIPSALDSVHDLTEIREKISGNLPARGVGISPHYNWRKLMFSPKTAHRWLTLYPGELHQLSFPFRTPNSVPFEQNTFDELRETLNPEVPRDTAAFLKLMPGGMNLLVIGNTYRLRVRPSKEIHWHTGTKDDLIRRYNETLQQRAGESLNRAVIPREDTPLHLVGMNEIEFLVEA